MEFVWQGLKDGGLKYTNFWNPKTVDVENSM